MRNRGSGVRRMALVWVAAIVLVACAVGDTGAARYVADESATFEGLLHNTQSGSTRYWFEYGPTTAYGTSTTDTSTHVLAGTPASVAVAVEGLQPGTTYHYRLCAVDDDADPQGICGADRTFTTSTGRESVRGEGSIVLVSPLGMISSTTGSVAAAGDPGGTGYLDGSAFIGGFFTGPPPDFGLIYWGGSGGVVCLRVEGNVAVVGTGGAVLVVQDNGPIGDRMTWFEWSSSTCPEPDVSLFGGGGFLTAGDFVVDDD
jgi:hypothetical protein